MNFVLQVKEREFDAWSEASVAPLQIWRIATQIAEAEQKKDKKATKRKKQKTKEEAEDSHFQYQKQT